MDLWRPILILLATIGLFAVFVYIIKFSVHTGWRFAILTTYVVFGVLNWFITEALGVFKAITINGLCVSWGLVGIIAVVIATRLKGSRFRSDISEVRKDLLSFNDALSPAARGAMIYMLFSAAILAITAFIGAPNTWDSLTYHMSRVMHWQQDRSLFFYATAIQRQLSFGPQAEMSILHLSVLSGSDRLANFVQYFAMVGCVVGVSLLAEKLGGGIDAQSFAALATMTLPIGVLQATSTQNDYVVSFWCLCFTLFVLEQIKKTDTDTLAGFAGVALGLAMLTKATAILFLAPVGTWFMIHLIHRNRFGAVRLFSMVAVVSIVIVFPHFFRTYRLYGNPLGITSGLELGKLTNDVFSPAIAASNILRNVGLQLASPMEGLNQLMQSGIGWAHARLGIDISDPRSTWQDLQFRMEFSMYEDSAGNPLHFLVVLFAIPCLVRSGSRGKTTYLLCLVSGFILFCALLKWQPWNSRLILPLFILAMPVVAVLLSGCLRKGRVFLPGILLAVGAIPYIFTNPSRPLIGSNNIFTRDRFHEYFANVPDDPFIYDAAARMIGEARCDQIGLAGSPDGREYLVWVSNQVYNQNAHIEHILVKNISRKLQTDFTPCAIVIQYPIEEQVLDYENYNYQRMIGNERFSLYLTSERYP